MAAQETKTMTRQQKAYEYESRSSHWLAEGNFYQERGNKAKAEKCYAKSQYWLDRANIARGWN